MNDVPGQPAESRPASPEPPESGELFRQLVEAVQDYAILMLDEHGRIVSWNRGVERLCGYRQEDVLGRSFTIFHRPEDVASGEPQRELERARTEGRLETEGWRVRKDGSAFWA